MAARSPDKREHAASPFARPLNPPALMPAGGLFEQVENVVNLICGLYFCAGKLHWFDLLWIG